jgi:UDP-4-amino-4,6-dideoxy-N-acetyl-beta-L-altrosamine N-acetyltransferase
MRPLAEGDLETVLEWRNSDRVRSKMFESHLIPWETHLKWFKSLTGNPNQKCWMFLFQSRPIGVITIKKVDEPTDTWIWGCYLGPMRAVPKAGTTMGYCALEHFFERMKVRRVIGEAVAANTHSLEFNARLGFKTEKHFSKTNTQGVGIPAVLLTYTLEEWMEKGASVARYCFEDSGESHG